MQMTHGQRCCFRDVTFTWKSNAVVVMNVNYQIIASLNQNCIRIGQCDWKCESSLKGWVRVTQVQHHLHFYNRSWSLCCPFCSRESVFKPKALWYIFACLVTTGSAHPGHCNRRSAQPLILWIQLKREVFEKHAQELILASEAIWPCHKNTVPMKSHSIFPSHVPCSVHLLYIACHQGLHKTVNNESGVLEQGTSKTCMTPALKDWICPPLIICFCFCFYARNLHMRYTCSVS